MGERLGYGRVSTSGQNLEGQVERLKKFGCDKIFQEKISAGKSNRPELKKALEYAREGDTFIVVKLDRLGRSLADLTKIVAELERKKVELVVIDQKIDTTTISGKLLFHLLACISEFEAGLINSRMSEGRERAKAQGIKFGRKVKLTEKQEADLVKHFYAGEMTRPELARKYKIGVASVYRIVEKAKKKFGDDERQTNLIELIEKDG